MKLRVLLPPVSFRRAVVVAQALVIASCDDGPSRPEVGPEAGKDGREQVTTEVPTAPGRPVDSVADLANVDVNLAHLANLGIFEVGGLVTDTPRAGGSCYGYPCPEERDAIAQRLASDLARLVALTHDLTPAASPCSSLTVDAKADAHLAVLDQLDIVEIGAFIKATPANNPLCYGFPCSEDRTVATAHDCHQAALLETLAIRASATFDVKPPPVFGALSEATENQIRQDLARLASLDLFEVGPMVVLPGVDECYRMVPPDDVLAHNVARLGLLAASAEALLAHATHDYRDTDPDTFAGCTPIEGATALAALEALQVVEVGALIARDAASEGLCYVGACSDALEARAHAMVCRRADAIARLVAAFETD